MPAEERPYEKCERYGPGSLSDSELLSVIIRTGTKELNARELALSLLSRYCSGGGVDAIARLGLEELRAVPGIGRVKSIQIMCMCEFSKRLWRSGKSVKTTFTGPEDMASFYMEKLRRLDHEECWILMMDNKGAWMGEFMLSSGTVNSSLISPREVFVNASKASAVRIALIHNHPSGDPAPSAEDVRVTARLLEAGKLMDIHLVDSIIIGDGIYVSIRKSGLIRWQA